MQNVDIGAATYDNVAIRGADEEWMRKVTYYLFQHHNPYTKVYNLYIGFIVDKLIFLALLGDRQYRLS